MNYNKMLMLMVCIIYANNAHSMLCLTKNSRLFTLVGVRGKADNIDDTYIHLCSKFDAISLKSCVKAYWSGECENAVCTRSAFTSFQNTKLQQVAHETRQKFLRQIDVTGGRIEAGSIIQELYGDLESIEEEINYHLRKNENDTKYRELRDVLQHQKDCFFTQFRIIQEDSPMVVSITRAEFIIDEQGRPLVDVSSNDFVATEQTEKE